MAKIKEISKYNGSSWETAVPIGANASNVDVNVSGSSVQDLQTVLGTPTKNSPLQTQINGKLGTSGDGKSTTVGTIDDSADTSKDTTASAVVATSGDSQQTLWGKFNKLRRRVNNKFGDYFASSGIKTSLQSSGSDSQVYSTSMLNSYFANVIGYSAASDLPDASSTVAAQLSSLNSKTINATPTQYTSTTGTGLASKVLFQVLPGIVHVYINTYTVQAIGHGHLVGELPSTVKKPTYVVMGILAINHNTWADAVLYINTNGNIHIMNQDANSSTGASTVPASTWITTSFVYLTTY